MYLVYNLYPIRYIPYVMPIIKSAIKRVRQQAKRRSHNIAIKKAVRQDIRSFLDAAAAGDTAKTTEAFKAAVSEIDRAVKKGTLHKNTAARRKSQLARVAKESAGSQPAKPAAKAKTTAKPKATAKKTTKTSK